MDLVELMIYPIVTNYLSVNSRYRLYQIWSYLLHESFPSNFVLLNFVKYSRNICLKNKNTESTKSLTSYSVTYLKIVLLTLLILRKFSKITRIFFKKSLEIPKNRPKIWKFLVTSSLAKPPSPLRHQSSFDWKPESGTLRGFEINS